MPGIISSAENEAILPPPIKAAIIVKPTAHFLYHYIASDK